MNELFLLEESVNSENFTTLPFHPTPALMSASGLLVPTPPHPKWRFRKFTGRFHLLGVSVFF